MRLSSSPHGHLHSTTAKKVNMGCLRSGRITSILLGFTYRGELDNCLQRLMAERGKRQAKRQAMENEFSSNINKMAKGVENLRQEASIIQQMMSGSAPSLNHSTSHPHMDVNPSTYYSSSVSLPMFRGD
ncbi:hypothetical protein BKA91DRAFT_147785 [Yarrowia lipolytica]|nr:hypothetical protein BKA91DRAFT_147785 [Yarrowia lipolytica]KAE8173046.1 hypothetical protein BKA90DRAFT_146185 [Yarrowia lipolytica]RMI96081.1 hypothetical protein BD777DRAFT_160128 [Yarrowia lipolytica]